MTCNNLSSTHPARSHFLTLVILIVLLKHDLGLVFHCFLLSFCCFVCRFCLFCQDLQVAVVAESSNITNDSRPDDDVPRRRRETVDLQEWQQQSQEDQCSLVEVATKSCCRG